MPMTRHKHAQTGLVTPQLPQQWLTAVLRAFAMLVLNVVSTFQMNRRHARVNATRAMPTVLPRAETDNQQQETQSVAASDTLIVHHTPACHPGSAKRYPGPIHPVGRTSQWFSALRFAAAGMTIIAQIGAAQPARPHNPAPLSLRSSRRKSGPRASRVMCVGSGPHQQPWIPACAVTSGFLSPPNKNATA